MMTLGNQSTQTDAEGRTTHWEYDALGRVTKRTLPLGQSETMTYDPVGNMLTHTDFKGQTTTYVYNNMNRRTQAIYADGRIEQWSYDANGNTLTASITIGSDVKTTAYEYDVRDRLSKETKPNGDVLSYTYDLNGNKLSFSHKVSGAATGITTSYTYDAVNRLKTTTNHKGGVTTYSYDLNGNRSEVEHSNGLSTEYQYDPRNRLTDLSHKAADGSVVKSFGYTLHATGRRTKITENDGRVTDYVYDDLYRLVSEEITDSVNGMHSSAYTYDKVGNRIGEVVNGVTTAYSYDLNDRLSQTGGTVYTYDANGSTLTETLDADVTTYTYNAQNRLVTAQKVIAGTTKLMSYSYDIEGIRTTNTVDGVATEYLVDHNQDYSQVVQESVNDVATVTYTYADDLIAQDRSDVVSTYLYDGHGTTRGLSDVDAIISDTYNYEAFGEILNQSGSTENNYLYAGEQRDSDLELDYLRARYLDAGIARFTQMDTWMGKSMDPVTLNKYLYANSDPARYVDPSGRSGTLSGMMTGVKGAVTLTLLATAATYQMISVQNPGLGQEASDKLLGIISLMSNATGASLDKLSSLISSRHGNSKKSKKKHHIYRIYDTFEHDVYKYGISGVRLRRNGKSGRLEGQLRKLNRPISDRYNGIILYRNVPGRMAALAIELRLVNDYARENNGSGPRGNILPQPTI